MNQKIALELKITNPSEMTTHFKVSTIDYLPPDSTFLKFYSILHTLQGLKRLQNNIKLTYM